MSPYLSMVEESNGPERERKGKKRKEKKRKEKKKDLKREGERRRHVGYSKFSLAAALVLMTHRSRGVATHKILANSQNFLGAAACGGLKAGPDSSAARFRRSVGARHAAVERNRRLQGYATDTFLSITHGHFDVAAITPASVEMMVQGDGSTKWALSDGFTSLIFPSTFYCSLQNLLPP